MNAHRNDVEHDQVRPDQWERGRGTGTSSSGTSPGRSSGSSPGELSPAQRLRDLARLSGEPLDVLVVGGGITGAGTALDAATRGLSVGIVEAQDWASGTSSRSSKLVHGGLRYLEMLDFRLVHEGLKERALLLRRLAPHLVHPVPIMWPLHGRVVERAYVGAGIALYDLLGLSTGTGRGLPLHRHLSRRRALEMAPALRPDALTGAVLYYDAQVDDARYVVDVVRTAVASGAAALNRAAVVRFICEGERVVGAVVRDTETGEEFAVHAKVTVIATGAWTEETEALAGRQRAVRVRPSKGAHLLVAGEKLKLSTGLITRTESSVLFVLPWGAHWLIGTTDTDWDFGKARPLATSSDVDYLLAQVNTVVAEPLKHSDVEAVYAGLRPLVAGSGVVRGPGEGRGGGRRRARQTTGVSREHAIGRPAPGLVVVSGGKFTTYRVMAADAVDAVVSEGRFRQAPSVTERVPLLGADGFKSHWEKRRELAQRHGLSSAQLEHLLHRYGGLVDEVLGTIDACPSLAVPVVGAGEYLQAEAVYAVTHEGARHLDDVLTRRLRISMETGDGGAGAAPGVAELMASTLRWDEVTRASEIEDYGRQVALVLEAATAAPDDAVAAQLSDRTPSLLPFP